VWRHLLNTLLYLVIITPLLVITLRKREKSNIRYAILFAAFFLVGSLIRVAPFEFESIQFSTRSMWNWSGKLYATVFSIIFVLSYRKIPLAEYGVTWRQQPFSIMPCLILTTFMIASGFVIGSLTGIGSRFNVEYLSFQLTMPGFDEEIFFRGIGLALLNRALGKNWDLFGAKVGWGLIIISLLFSVVHAVSLTAQLELRFDLFEGLLTLLSGFLLGWLRERSGSLVFPIAAHNLGNVALNLLSALCPLPY
jgi:membrane protease YdiL (CAAX protease family)